LSTWPSVPLPTYKPDWLNSWTLATSVALARQLVNIK
jgi:hypothetical protein